MGHYAPMPRGRWVIASLVPVGWLTWLGFGYAGFRAKRPLWVAFGVDVRADRRGRDRRHRRSTRTTTGIEDDLGYLAMFLGWGAGIAHSFVIRKAYLRRMAHPRGPGAAGRAARRASARPTPASWRSATRSSPARRRSAAPAASTRAAWSTSTTPPSRTSPTCRASTPRRRAGSSRRATSVGGFSSLEDLGMTMDLPGDVVEALRGRVVFLPR